MATRTPEEGKGVLFSADKKGNPKAPDFKGEIMVEGKIIKLAAWKRQSAYGELISLAHNTYSGGAPSRSIRVRSTTMTRTYPSDG